MARPEVFEPATLSIAELEFLLDHLDGEDVVVALHDLTPDKVKAGVNRREIKKWLSRFHELEALEKHRDVPWAGYGAVRDSIVRYLDWDKRCREIQASGGPRLPSMFNFTPEGEIYRGGVGSDSSTMVRSEILDNGERKRFGVPLTQDRNIDPGARSRMPWLGTTKRVAMQEDKIVADAEKGTLTCSICNHTESYDRKKGRAALSMARGRMGRHLKIAKTSTERHRMLHRREFRAVA